MGRATAGVTAGERRTDFDFALIGHQESWRAAADVLAVLRGAERAPLPDEEIREIFPWIPPRAVCHVEVASATGAQSAWPVHRLASFLLIAWIADYVHDNIGRVRAAAACAINAGAKIVSLGGFSSILIEGNFHQLPEKNRYDLHDREFTDGSIYRSRHQENVCAGRAGYPQIDAPHRWSNR